MGLCLPCRRSTSVCAISANQNDIKCKHVSSKTSNNKGSVYKYLLCWDCPHRNGEPSFASNPWKMYTQNLPEHVKLTPCGLVMPSRSWSSLIQVMAWCCPAPSHYRNQCRLSAKKMLYRTHQNESLSHRMDPCYTIWHRRFWRRLAQVMAYHLLTTCH